MIQVTDCGLEQAIVETGGLLAVWFFDYESIPCDHSKPEVVRVAKEFPTIKFVKINVVENPLITEEMLIEALPTLLVVKDADEIGRFEGPYSFETMADRFKSILERAK